MIWVVIFAASVGTGWILGRGDAADNLRAAASGAPMDLTVAMLGVSLGLYGRDRVRLHRAYSSPTLAYLGKRLLLAALAGGATYVLSPVAWPPGHLHGLAVLAALGGTLWIGNLPVRL